MIHRIIAYKHGFHCVELRTFSALPYLLNVCNSQSSFCWSCATLCCFDSECFISITDNEPRSVDSLQHWKSCNLMHNWAVITWPFRMYSKWHNPLGLETQMTFHIRFSNIENYVVVSICWSYNFDWSNWEWA